MKQRKAMADMPPIDFRTRSSAVAISAASTMRQGIIPLDPIIFLRACPVAVSYPYPHGCPSLTAFISARDSHNDLRMASLCSPRHLQRVLPPPLSLPWTARCHMYEVVARIHAAWPRDPSLYHARGVSSKIWYLLNWALLWLWC
jgi:hypothetical protein